VQEELVRLQESRQRQAQQVETLVRQRDMYYVLLKQNAADTPPPRPQVGDHGWLIPHLYNTITWELVVQWHLTRK
jgi:hypothetical protein